MWIKVTERLPKDESELVLISDGSGVIAGCYTVDDEWMWDDWAGPSLSGAVTHWMPMPEPPNSNAKESPADSPASPVQHAKHTETIREIAAEMDRAWMSAQTMDSSWLLDMVEKWARQLRALQ